MVDYSKSPDTHGTAAIDPVFICSQIKDEGGGRNYPFYWTSTTHINSDGKGSSAVYLSFGSALGFMSFGKDQMGGDKRGPEQERPKRKKPPR